MHMWHRNKATTPADAAVSATLATPATAPGQMTPARAAVHGDLMNRCNDPTKLRKAAALFGHEGLGECAQMLLSKAAMIHEMMHGAKNIVERSRAGDQHAIAMAKNIAENAAKGDRRAQISVYLIQQYTAATANGGAPEAPKQAA